MAVLLSVFLRHGWSLCRAVTRGEALDTEQTKCQFAAGSQSEKTEGAENRDRRADTRARVYSTHQMCRATSKLLHCRRFANNLVFRSPKPRHHDGALGFCKQK